MLTGWSVRDFVEADFDELVALWHETNLLSYPYVRAHQEHTLADASRFFRASILAECQIWVAESTSRLLLGFLAFNAPWIRQLAVFPSFQRQGIGTALLEKARVWSPVELRVFTFRRNTAARSFYEHHGFTAVALGVSPAPESEPDVQYRWRDAKLPVSVGKMHVREVDTDVALVDRLLAVQFPQWADLPIEPVHSAGTDNALYRLGDDMVVRLPRIQEAAEQADKEQQWLPRLAPLLPLAIPVPLAKGSPGEGYHWRWSVYRWLEDETVTAGRLADSCQAASELAQFIAALQRVDPAGGPVPGAHNFHRGVPLAMRDTATRSAISTLGGRLDVAAATSAWDAALQAPAWRNAPVWVHGDLQPGNLLLQHGRLSAVIDFGGLAVGDPACDLMVAWNLLDAQAREVFRTVLRVDDATWARGRGWALSFGLIALPYFQTTNPALAKIAKYAIDEVVADHKQTT